MANPKALTERRSVSINPDTTLNLHRPLVGEWVCLQGDSHASNGGSGTAFARIYDERGTVGHASQSILIRTADKRPESWREFDAMAEKKPR